VVVISGALSLVLSLDEQRKNEKILGKQKNRGRRQPDELAEGK